MKATTTGARRSSRREAARHSSRSAPDSIAAREKTELALTPAERLTLALELSDLCAELAAAGRRASQGRP